jgi:hypothetical protein
MGYAIDFENGKVIDSGNYRTRKKLESWHTAIITNSDNNSKPLPKQYMLCKLIKNVIAIGATIIILITSCYMYHLTHARL